MTNAWRLPWEEAGTRSSRLRIMSTISRPRSLRTVTYCRGVWWGGGLGGGWAVQDGWGRGGGVVKQQGQANELQGRGGWGSCHNPPCSTVAKRSKACSSVHSVLA